MAFDHTLLALGGRDGQFAVLGQIRAALDLQALQAAGRLQDVSDDAGYLDRAAIIARVDVPKFLPAGEAAREQVLAWLSGLPPAAYLIVALAEEWEGGLG